MNQQGKMDPEILNMILDTLSKLERDKVSLETKLEMDRTGEFPMDLIRFMLSPEVALHLIFVPEAYGGLGAGATEIAIVSERMAKMDLAIATAFLAICLGMDPIMVGSTPEQKEKYLNRLLTGEYLAATAITESMVGSSFANMQTAYKKKGECFSGKWG